jgi:hypothetical protein
MNKFMILLVLATSSVAWGQTYELKPHEARLDEPRGANLEFTHARIERVRIDPEPTLYYQRFNPRTGAQRGGYALSLGEVFEIKPNPDMDFLLRLIREYEMSPVSKRGADTVLSNREDLRAEHPRYDRLKIVSIVPMWDAESGELDLEVESEISDAASGQFVRVTQTFAAITRDARNPSLVMVMDKVQDDIETSPERYE